MKNFTKNALNQLNDNDIYSILLFVLFKLKEDESLAGLSELIYVLDKRSFLKLCEYFGGMTITIPTIRDIELLLDALLTYQKKDIEGSKTEVTRIIEQDILPHTEFSILEISSLYRKIKKIMDKYEFKHRD